MDQNMEQTVSARPSKKAHTLLYVTFALALASFFIAIGVIFIVLFNQSAYQPQAMSMDTKENVKENIEMTTSTKTDTEEKNENIGNVEIPKSEIRQIGPGQDIYRNFELGFSVQMPRVAYSDSAFTEPLDRLIKEHDNGVEIIYYRPNTDYSGGRYFEIASADSEADVEAFLQEKYNDECKISKFSQLDHLQDGVLQAEIAATENLACPISGGITLLYAPQFHRLAFWALGNDVIFLLKDGHPFEQTFMFLPLANTVFPAQ